MRGLAALYVLIFHLALVPAVKPPVPGWLHGFVMMGGSGVTLFFVVSAFSLNLTMWRHTATGHTMLSYAISRLFRIVPLFYLTMLLTYIMHVLVFGVWHPVTTVLLSASFLFNLIPGAQEGYVWASWAIGVEMLFYVIFPALYIWQRNSTRRIVVLCAALAAGMLFKGASAMLVPEALRASFENFSIFCHAPIFLIGMMAHALYAEPAFAARLRAYGPALIGLGLLGLLAFVAGRIGIVLLDVTYTIAFFYALLLLGVSGTRFAPVDNRVCIFLGKISYSIYLSHAPIMWLLSPVYARLVDLAVPTTLRFGLCLAVTLAIVLPVSWLSCRFVEAPCIQLGKRFFASRVRLPPTDAARA